MFDILGNRRQCLPCQHWRRWGSRGYKKGWLNCQKRTSFKTIKVAWFGRYWYFFCLNDQASTAWIHFLRDLLTDDDQFGRMCSEPVTICRKELWGRSFGVQDCSYLPVIFFSEEFQMEKLMMDCEDEDPRKAEKSPQKQPFPSPLIYAYSSPLKRREDNAHLPWHRQPMFTSRPLRILENIFSHKILPEIQPKI